MKRKAFLAVMIVVGVLLLFSGCDNLLSDDSSSGDSSTGVASLRVVNNSGTTIYYLYVSPSSSELWGNDQLGSSVISSGSSFTVNNIPAGTYDFRATNSSGYNVYEIGYYMGPGTSHTWTINSF